MKMRLYVDKVISLTSKGDRVGVYVKIKGEELLLAEMLPKRARLIQKLWNNKGISLKGV